MKKNFRIMISTDNISRLLSRILIIFNRRNLDIKSITFFKVKNTNINKYTIDLECIETLISHLIKQIEKIIGVNKAFYNYQHSEI